MGGETFKEANIKEKIMSSKNGPAQEKLFHVHMGFFPSCYAFHFTHSVPI